MIEIRNFAKARINKNFLKKIIYTVLKEEKKRSNIAISIVFLGEKKIKEFNKKFREKDSPTDVLSFPGNVFEKKGDNKFVEPPSSLLQLGEILICLPQVKKNARLQKENSWKKELTRVLIHGILHVLGYSHNTEKKDKVMMAKQEKYFSKFF